MEHTTTILWFVVGLLAFLLVLAIMTIIQIYRSSQTENDSAQNNIHKLSKENEELKQQLDEKEKVIGEQGVMIAKLKNNHSLELMKQRENSNAELKEKAKQCAAYLGQYKQTQDKKYQDLLTKYKNLEKDYEWLEKSVPDLIEENNRLKRELAAKSATDLQEGVSLQE